MGDTPEYYDNSKGSLYLFAEQQQLNFWEADLIKRIVRCRKKGNFEEDLIKSKNLIDLYLKEYKELEQQIEEPIMAKPIKRPKTTSELG